MTQPPYKAAPQAPVLYVKTANTWNASGGSIALPGMLRWATRWMKQP